MTRPQGAQRVATVHEAEPMGTNPGLDLSSAMVRAESQHTDATLHALLERLSSVPGLKVTGTYRHTWFRRLLGDLPYINDLHRDKDPVQRISVDVGPCTYWLDSHRSSIRCGTELAASIERGPVRDELPFSTWASRLFDD
ncbi:MAG: hypothetical protein ACYDA6_05815, partial [Solirubrobacteraceae bacterium]